MPPGRIRLRPSMELPAFEVSDYYQDDPDRSHGDRAHSYPKIDFFPELCEPYPDDDENHRHGELPVHMAASPTDV